MTSDVAIFVTETIRRHGAEKYFDSANTVSAGFISPVRWYSKTIRRIKDKHCAGHTLPHEKMEQTVTCD